MRPQLQWILCLEPKGPCALRIDRQIVTTRYESHVLNDLGCKRIPPIAFRISILLYERVSLTRAAVAKIVDQALGLRPREHKGLRTAAVLVHALDASEWVEIVLPGHDNQRSEGWSGNEHQHNYCEDVQPAIQRTKTPFAKKQEQKYSGHCEGKGEYLMAIPEVF